VSGFEYHVEGLPRVKAMLDRYSPRQMQNKMRRVVRAGANAFKPDLIGQARAHHGAGDQNVPLSFQKVPAAKVTTHGGAGSDVEAYIRPASPLVNIFEPGAGAHTISPHGKPLRGPAGPGGWTKVGRKRARDFMTRRSVQHPGLQSRPELPAAFQSGLPDALDQVNRVLFGE